MVALGNTVTHGIDSADQGGGYKPAMTFKNEARDGSSLVFDRRPYLSDHRAHAQDISFEVKPGEMIERQEQENQL